MNGYKSKNEGIGVVSEDISTKSKQVVAESKMKIWHKLLVNVLLKDNKNLNKEEIFILFMNEYKSKNEDIGAISKDIRIKRKYVATESKMKIWSKVLENVLKKRNEKYCMKIVLYKNI